MSVSALRGCHQAKPASPTCVTPKARMAGAPPDAVCSSMSICWNTARETRGINARRPGWTTTVLTDSVPLRMQLWRGRTAPFLLFLGRICSQTCQHGPGGVSDHHEGQRDSLS